MTKPYFLILLYLTSLSLFAQKITISPAGSMKIARWLHASATMGNGNIIVFGGADTDFENMTSFRSAEIYNIKTGTWSLTDSMNLGRSDPGAATLPDGNVLAIGGAFMLKGENSYLTKSCEIFDYKLNKWRLTDSLKTARSEIYPVVLKDGRILVAGSDYSRTCEIYNPATGKWQYADSTNYEYSKGFSTILLPDGKVLISGGEPYYNNAEIYDPGTDTWTETGTKLTSERKFHSSVLMNDGTVMLVGGQPRFFLNELLACDVYDPETDKFTEGSSLKYTKQSCKAVKLSTGNILAYDIGSTEVYDITTGTWTKKAGGYANGYTIHQLDEDKFIIIGGLAFPYSQKACYQISASIELGTETETKTGNYIYTKNGGEEMYIQNLPAKKLSLKLFGYSGTAISEMNLKNSQVISTCSLAPGIYIYMISDNESGAVIETGKLLRE